MHPTDWQLSTHSILSPIPATLSCQDMCTSEDLLNPIKWVRSKIFPRSQYSVSLFVNKTALGRLTLFAEYPQVPKNILDPNLRVPVSLDCAIFLLQGPGHEKSHFANNHHAAAAAAGAHWPCTLQPGRSGSQLGIRTTRLFSAFPHHCSRSDFEQTDIWRGFDEERASRLTSALVVSCSSLSSLKGFWRLTH